VRFIREVKDLYDFKRKIVELDDICYGSKIIFEMNNLGHVEISGTIYGRAKEHSLEFEFTTDQTVLLPFYEALYRDFINESRFKI